MLTETAAWSIETTCAVFKVGKSKGTGISDGGGGGGGWGKEEGKEKKSCAPAEKKKKNLQTENPTPIPHRGPSLRNGNEREFVYMHAWMELTPHISLIVVV